MLLNPLWYKCQGSPGIKPAVDNLLPWELSLMQTPGIWKLCPDTWHSSTFEHRSACTDLSQSQAWKESDQISVYFLVEQYKTAFWPCAKVLSFIWWPLEFHTETKVFVLFHFVLNYFVGVIARGQSQRKASGAILIGLTLHAHQHLATRQAAACRTPGLQYALGSYLCFSKITRYSMLWTLGLALP